MRDKNALLLSLQFLLGIVAFCFDFVFCDLRFTSREIETVMTHITVQLILWLYKLSRSYHCLPNNSVISRQLKQLDFYIDSWTARNFRFTIKQNCRMRKGNFKNWEKNILSLVIEREEGK